MAGLHRRRKRATTTDSYAAMLTRMVSAYGRRITEDPAAGLGHLRDIETALTDAVNLGLHDALTAGKSATDLANVLGVSRQAIYKRAGLGEQVARRRIASSGDISARVARPRELPPAS